MKDSEKELVRSLEAALGLRVPDPKLAIAALTHRSWANEHPELAQEDNERLEFLGDAVIDLAVSQRLMELLPDAKEGTLSRMRAALVNAEVLAEVATEMGLGELLRLGKGEERTGGRRKISLLSNCLEAVIAAVFARDGISPVLDLVDRRLVPKIGALGLDLSGGRDYKTQAQEKAQLLLGETPRYRVVAERGPDHERLFSVHLVVGESVLGEGEGRSKKEAEQKAAHDALHRIEEASAAASPEESRAVGDGEARGESSPAIPSPQTNSPSQGEKSDGPQAEAEPAEGEQE